MSPEERWRKIENALETVAERHAEFELYMLRAEKRQDRADERQDRLERRVALFARAGIREGIRNRQAHIRIDATLDKVGSRLDQTGLRLTKITHKLDAMIDVVQRQQPPQQ